VVGTPIGPRDRTGLLRAAAIASGIAAAAVGLVLATLALALAGQRDSHRHLRST
jgi:hypothetical protein